MGSSRKTPVKKEKLAPSNTGRKRGENVENTGKKWGIRFGTDAHTHRSGGKGP